MRTTFAILLFVLCACSGVTRVYEKYLDEWEGKDRTELVAKLGQPDRIHSFTDGRKVYEYRFADTYGGPAKFNKFRRETSSIPKGCLTWFYIDQETNIVDSWKWEGTQCELK